MSIDIVFAIVLCNMISLRGSKVLISLFAIELGAPQFYIGAIIATYSLFPMLLGLYAGKLSDRVGVRPPMLAGSIGVSFALLLPYLFPTLAGLYASAALLGTIAFVLGLGMGCGQPLTLTLIYSRAPHGRSGEALGLRLTINNLMHIGVPLIFGTIGSMFGVWPVFVANSLLLTGSGVLSPRADKTH